MATESSEPRFVDDARQAAPEPATAAESSPPSSPEEQPLVFTDGVEGVPVATTEPAAEPVVRVRPKLGPVGPAKPVAERTCLGCKKRVRVDLLACPFCARRFDRASKPLEASVERADGGVLPATLAREFAEARTRDAEATTVERHRRIANRARLSLLGLGLLVPPPVVLWIVLAPPRFLAPAIALEVAAAWVLLRVLLSTRGGAVQTLLATAPIAIGRIFAGMIFALALEASAHAPGELVAGTEGRGAGAAFAMIAGSAILTFVTAAALGVGIDMARDDFAAPDLRGARASGLGPRLRELLAAFKGVFSLALDVPPPPRAPSAPAAPSTFVGSPMQAPDPTVEAAPPPPPVAGAGSFGVLGLLTGTSALYWIMMMVPAKVTALGLVIDLVGMGVVFGRIPRGDGRVVALVAGVVRLIAGAIVGYQINGKIGMMAAVVFGFGALQANVHVASGLPGDVGGSR